MADDKKQTAPEPEEQDELLTLADALKKRRAAINKALMTQNAEAVPQLFNFILGDMVEAMMVTIDELAKRDADLNSRLLDLEEMVLEPEGDESDDEGDPIGDLLARCRAVFATLIALDDGTEPDEEAMAKTLVEIKALHAEIGSLLDDESSDDETTEGGDDGEADGADSQAQE